MNDIPRRIRIDLQTPIEAAIRAARDAVEGGPAHPHMTRATVLLGRALDAVADFVDGVPIHPAPADDARARVDEDGCCVGCGRSVQPSPCCPDYPADDASAEGRAAVEREMAETMRVNADDASGAEAMRRFPIIGGPSIPWWVIAPHEAQAMRNHGGQTLERLAERGGLSPTEALCVIEDRAWSRGRDARADHDALAAMVIEWDRPAPLPATDDAVKEAAVREAFVAHMATVGVTDVAWTNALGPVGTRADHYGVMLSVEWERFAAGYRAALPARDDAVEEAAERDSFCAYLSAQKPPIKPRWNSAKCRWEYRDGRPYPYCETAWRFWMARAALRREKGGDRG